MKVFLFSMALAMLAVSYLPRLPALTTPLIVGAAVLASLLAIGCFIFHQRIMPLVWGCLGLAAGGVIATILCGQLIQQQLPAELEGEPVLVKGWVKGLPEQTGEGDSADQARWRFDLKVQSAQNLSSVSPTIDACKASVPSAAGSNTVELETLRLSWWLKNMDVGLVQSVVPGKPLCLLVKLRRPRGLVNPAGFDYQRWLLSSGYSASGYVLEGQISDSIQPPSFSQRISIGIDQHRLAIREKLLAHGREESIVASVLALTIGDKSRLNDQQWQQLRLSGTLHLLVVSGLHISLMAALGALIGSALSRLLALKTQRFSRLLPFVVSVSFAAAYAALAGFTLPTQRALVMALVANSFWFMGWHKQPWLGFWLAAVLVLALDPLAGHGSGFWLSFAVVAVILVSLPSVNRTRSHWRVARLQGSIFLGMLVPLGVSIGSISVWAPLVNLIAIPFVSLAVVPVALCAVFASTVTALAGLFKACLWVTSQLLSVFWQALAGLQAVSQLEPFDRWAMVPLPTAYIEPWQWLLMALLAALAFIPLLMWPVRVLLCASIGLFLTNVATRPSYAELTVLDVGQGLASVALIEGRVLVYDLGPSYSESFGAAEDVLTPYLRSLGVTRIDLLVISHGDADHASGLEAFVHNFDVQEIISGEPDRLSVAAKNCTRGDQWRWSGAELSILWPTDTHSKQSSNDQSCVLLLQAQGRRVLFSGDVGKSVEWYLAEQVIEPVDILLAPHHGSKTSSSHRFIATLAPESVVFSAGFNNRYGHPNEAVVQRYLRLIDPQLWNTATDGAVVFRWRLDESVTGFSWRQQQRRLWF